MEVPLRDQDISLLIDQSCQHRVGVTEGLGSRVNTLVVQSCPIQEGGEGKGGTTVKREYEKLPFVFHS